MKVVLGLMMRSLMVSSHSITWIQDEAVYDWREEIGKRLTISLEHGGFALEPGSYDSG